MPETSSFDRARLHARYSAGESAEAVIGEAYRRIDAAADPGIFLDLAPEAALEAVRKLPPFDPVRFPLWGLPCAVKDNIDVAGRPTTAACPAFAYVPEQDAPAVAALRAAGAIIVGKTNLDQFATGLVGLRTPYPVPKNALDPAVIPGGSSSGSAVAVARGLVSFALGTDTAGSGRVPAGLNNIVGLKPSLGAVSTRGVIPACRTLDCVSVFALTVDDAWAAFAAMAGFDANDPFARERPVSEAIDPLSAPFRCGVPAAASRRFFGDDDQADAFDRAVAELEALGGNLVDVDFEPFYEVASLLYEGGWVAERLAAIEPFFTARSDTLHPVTRQIIGGAESLSAVDAFKGLYRLQALSRQLAPVIDGVDVLAVPTTPTIYAVADVAAAPIETNSRLGTYTNFVNLLDLCGIAVPTAPRRDGKPGAVTLLARGGHDGRVATLARALHGRSGVTLGASGASLPSAPARPEPSETPETLGPDELALVVVGAHMSGMALEDELRSRRGRLLRPARTAPVYRFYALPGSPPRPGLVRSGSDGDGVAIDCEVWALPLIEVGGFLAQVPPPLSIGSVVLDDGSHVHGFLAEAAAVDDSEDISAHGGWRAFVNGGS